MKKLIYALAIIAIATTAYCGTFFKEVHAYNGQHKHETYTIPCHDVTYIYLSIARNANGEGYVTTGSQSVFCEYSYPESWYHNTWTGTDLHTGGYVEFEVWTKSVSGAYAEAEAYVRW